MATHGSSPIAPRELGGALGVVVGHAAQAHLVVVAHERIGGARVAVEGHADRAGIDQLHRPGVTAEGEMGVAEDEPPVAHVAQQLAVVVARPRGRRTACRRPARRARASVDEGSEARSGSAASSSATASPSSSRQASAAACIGWSGGRSERSLSQRSVLPRIQMAPSSARRRSTVSAGHAPKAAMSPPSSQRSAPSAAGVREHGLERR